MLTPVVAFVTKARSSGSAPRNRPSPVARVVERRLEVTGEERDGLALHPRTPRVLGLEHGARRCAERPVVQEGHRGVERPVDGELGGHRLGIVRPMPDSNRPDAIVFDLDGTLVDTVGARIDAWQAAFAERGLVVDADPARADDRDGRPAARRPR